MGKAFDLPALWLTAWWALWALQALWCWYNTNLFRRRLRKQREPAEALAKERFEPHAAVVVPVKGGDGRLGAHVAGMAAQAYPSYELIYVVESASDPAAERVRQALSRSETGVEASAGLRGWRIIEAGLSEGEGQKVHNLRRGLAEALAGEAEAIVFADADAVAGEQWLSRMVWPLRRASIGATTGYRWIVPGDGAIASKVVSIMNASVATLLGPDRRNHVWGGSMAVRRSFAEEQDLDGRWRGALSDDYQMTRAVRASGKSVYFVMRNLLPSPVSMDWRRLMEFGRRQYLITRVHAPGIWWTGLLATGAYTGAWVMVVIAAIGGFIGLGWGLVAAAVVTLADTQRAVCRGQVIRDAMPAETARRLKPTLRWDRWATPAIMAVHLAVILSSAVGRTIEWAGVRYRLKGRQRVEVLGREQASGP